MSKRYKLFLGDCLEVMKKIPDKKVDCIICDLPYGTTACKWDTVIPFEPLWEQYKRIRKDNAPIVLFGSEPFSSYLRMSNIKEYRYDWIYIKEKGTGFAISHKQPLRKHEIISVFYKNQPFYDYKGEKLEKPYTHTLPIKKSDSNRVSSANITKNNGRIKVSYEYKTKDNVLYFSRNQKGSLHPTQKPIALLEYLVKTYTLENEIVLDNCMGSGTTGVACINTNRKFIGIEKEEKYFNIAKERIEKAEKEYNDSKHS